MKPELQKEITVPSGITATTIKDTITIKGPKGELARTTKDPNIKIKSEEGKITLNCKKGTKRQKRMINSLAAHVTNMIEGVQKPYQYKLKICSGHFPINVSTSGDQLLVKNFLGEKSPRTLKLKKNVSIKIEGDQILLESPDIEMAGQLASDIELLTAKTNRDLRVFQDGIYIIEKPERKI